MFARSTLVVLFCVLVASSTQAAAQERVEFTLANGLRVRLVPAQDEQRVTVILGVRAGFFDEPKGVPHVAHVTEHLAVFDLKGAAERQAVERWYKQGQANGETLGDLMYLDLHVGADELVTALRVQAARLGGAEFSRESLAREIPRTLQEIEFLEKSEHGGTGKFALAPFAQAALYGAAEVPIKARTQKITLDEVRAFHGRTFRPDRAMLVVVGALDPVATRREIEKLFAPIRTPERKPAPRPALKPGTLKVTWDVPTRHLILAWPTPAATTPDHAALTLVSTILGQRLYVDRDLATLVKLPLVSNNEEGILIINLQLKPDADAEIAKAKVMEHVARVGRADGVNGFELTQAKAFMTQLTKPVNLDNVPLPRNITKTMARANMELQRMMREMTCGELKAYVEGVEQLKTEDVRSTVVKHLPAEKATVVHVSPTRQRGMACESLACASG